MAAAVPPPPPFEDVPHTSLSGVKSVSGLSDMGARSALGYDTVPSEAEFFAKIDRREKTLSALQANIKTPLAGGESGYRVDLIERLNRVHPFEKYVMKVWRNVQSAGWSSAEKARLVHMFGTDDDWKIAFHIAKKHWEDANQNVLLARYRNATEFTDLLGENVHEAVNYNPNWVSRFI